MARPRLPGWPLESRSNAGSREMITGPSRGVTESGLQALSGVSLEFLRTGMLGRRPMGRVWVGSKATKVTASPFSFLKNRLRG